MDKVNGYKCFKEGLITNFGDKMKLGTLYESDCSPKFRSTGYHFCTNMEDTFRYFDTQRENVVVCEVTGYPDFSIYNDEYYGYYDMYSCKKIVLNNILTRGQLIEHALMLPERSIVRFVRDFCLTQNELDFFLDMCADNYMIMCQLIFSYYNKNIYLLDYESKKKMIDYYAKGDGKHESSVYIKTFKT